MRTTCQGSEWADAISEQEQQRFDDKIDQIIEIVKSNKHQLAVCLEDEMDTGGLRTRHIKRLEKDGICLWKNDYGWHVTPNY